MASDAVDPLVWKPPPIEISFSDLTISPRSIHYNNALKALRGYWCQAIVMTKEEQEECRKLLITQKSYIVPESAINASDHILYWKIQRKKATWPRWVILSSLYDYNVPQLHEKITSIHRGSYINDNTSQYMKYFSAEITIGSDMEYGEDDHVCGNDNSEEEQELGSQDEDHIRDKHHVESQGGSDHEPDNDNGEDTNHEQDSKSEQDVEEQQRPAELYQIKQKRRQRVESAEADEQLLELVAMKAAHHVAAELGKKFDCVMEAVKTLSEDTAELIKALNTNTEKFVEAMVQCQK
ncbi:hypothetical protein V8C42DRAFT_310688 [Trichoderma barbatum]